MGNVGGITNIKCACSNQCTFIANSNFEKFLPGLRILTPTVYWGPPIFFTNLLGSNNFSDRPFGVGKIFVTFFLASSNFFDQPLVHNTPSLKSNMRSQSWEPSPMATPPQGLLLKAFCFYSF